jgi:hypothetical protein
MENEKINFNNREWKTRKNLLKNKKIEMWVSPLQIIKLKEGLKNIKKLSEILQKKAEKKYHLSKEQKTKLLKKGAFQCAKK